MIKIVSGHSYADGSSVAFVNLCNQLNSRGHTCIFYADNWRSDKCSSGTLLDFKPEEGDVIILHGIKLLSIMDLHTLKSILSAAPKNHIWQNLWCAISEPLFPSSTSGKFKLVLSYRESDSSHKIPLRYSLFDKIHFLSSTQTHFHKTKRPKFVCPDFLSDLRPSRNKPGRTAGIIGSISEANATKEALEKALEDGMQAVILYGHLADPIYYYQQIVPLTKSHPGKIKFAGFIDDQQKMYDSVSDVYASASKPWSIIQRECAITNTRYHDSEAPMDENMTNDQIYQIWEKELEL